MGMTFEEKLKIGQEGESRVLKYIASVPGNVILKACDLPPLKSGGGPRLSTADGETLVSPDGLILNKEGVLWVEVKNKTRFTWHRNSRCFCAGIDKLDIDRYREVKKQTGRDVVLCFLIRSSEPSANDASYPSCPKTSPTGLFSVEIDTPTHHTTTRYGLGGGMVYWSHNQLDFIANLEDIPN